MARVRDLWYSELPVKDEDGSNVLDEHGRVRTRKVKSKRHPDNGGSRNAKRYLAVWLDPDGRERTKAFRKQSDAQKYADRQEADAKRGEYIDPRAAKERFGPLAEKHLRLRRKKNGKPIGEATRIRTMSVYRHHVAPVFGHKLVQAIRASDIAEWLQGPLRNMSGGVQETAYHIVAGTFDLAVADQLRRDNPARAVTPPNPDPAERVAWSVDLAQSVRDELPEPYRPLIDCGAGLGARQGEMFGLAVSDFALEAETVTVARQVRRVGRQIVFKLPKGGKTRTVPLPRGTAAVMERHIQMFPPVPVTLPWMKEDGTLGDPVTALLLFTWQPTQLKRVAGQCLAAGNFMQDVWKPALSRLGIIPPPVRTKHRWLVYKIGDGHHNGMHAPRHVYQVMLDDGGVSEAGKMEFMGHSRKSLGITVGVYGHVTPETFERAREAVDQRLYKLRSIDSAGTVTEFRAARLAGQRPDAGHRLADVPRVMLSAIMEH